MIFRADAPMGLLEIFPPMSYARFKSPPPHFFWLACSLGFKYDLLFGREIHEFGDYSSSFFVDIERFRQKLLLLIT